MAAAAMQLLYRQSLGKTKVRIRCWRYAWWRTRRVETVEKSCGSLSAKMSSMCYHLYLLLGLRMSGVRSQQPGEEIIMVSSVEEIQRDL
jgi:hypothetical protein